MDIVDLKRDRYLFRKMVLNIYYNGGLDIAPENTIDQQILGYLFFLSNFVGILLPERVSLGDDLKVTFLDTSSEDIAEFPLPLKPVTNIQEKEISEVLGESYKNVPRLKRLIDGFETRRGLELLVQALQRVDPTKELKTIRFECSDFTSIPTTPHEASVTVEHLKKFANG